MAALPENDRIAGPYIASAGQTDFPADFPLLRPEGLRARVQRGVSSHLRMGDDVSAVNLTGSGFTARLSEPCLAGDRVWIYSDLPRSRPRAHMPFGATRTEILEADAMETQAQMQEMRRDLDGTFRVEPGEPPLTAEEIRAAGAGAAGVGQAVEAAQAAQAAAEAAAAAAGGGVNRGGWDAAQNSPAIVSGVGKEGDFYTVIVEGARDVEAPEPDAGPVAWKLGDQILFSAGKWTRQEVLAANLEGSNIVEKRKFRASVGLFIVTPEDHGAKGDGVTDDTAAIKAAILARRAGNGVLQFGRKKYVFKEPLVDHGAYMAWKGENSVLVWDGATTGDMITFGQAGSELLFPLVEGLMVKTKKVMTSGWMMVAHAPARGVFRDLVIQGIDGAGEFGGRPYNGLYFNGYSYVSVQRIETGGSAGAQTAIGIRGIPMGAQAGLFFEGGNRISGFDIGIRNGGGNGGVYFDQTDVIGNVTANVLHDNSYEAQHNREIFWSSTCSIDSGSSLGCYVIDQNGGGPSLIVFDKTWICSAQGTLAAPGGAPGFGAGLYLKRGPDVRMIGSLYLHNHGGDAFRCDEPECDVLLEGLCMNNKGWGINRTAANMRVHAAGMIFVQNLLGDQNPAFAPATSFVDHDRLRARHIRIQNGGQLTLDPTFYLHSNGGVDPFINFDPSTYHRWNRSTREHEFSSDGNMTLRLGAMAMNLGGAGFIRYKKISGFLDGSGNVNGVDAAPAHSSLMLLGFITVADGASPGRTSAVQVQMEGNNYYAVGGAGNAGKAYKGMIIFDGT